MARFGNISRRVSVSRAFTLIDILVSISVIAVLIGILLPSLGSVNRAARRVVCASNIRQIGLGMRSYADMWQGSLPPSSFVPGWNTTRATTYRPGEMMKLRVASDSQGLWNNSWDGLGRLFSNGDLPAPKLFFCPAHTGEHNFNLYANAFGPDPREIISNYQYRGRAGTDLSRNLDSIIPLESALVSDGMSSKSDFNHITGMNVLRGDQSVVWFPDTDRSFWYSLPDGGPDSDGGAGDEASANRAVEAAWLKLDQQAPRDSGR